MARRVVISKKEIYRMRGTNWEWHYQHHVMVRGLGSSLDREKIARVIAREVPAPIMRIDGSLLEGMDVARGVARAMVELSFSYAYRDLICSWYWSNESWDSFVRLFQSLPEVEEDYYLLYDADLDAALIVPMSQREPNSNKGTKKVHLGTSTPFVPLSRSNMAVSMDTD